MRRMLVVTLCGALLGGCATLSRLLRSGFREPQLRFSSAKLVRASLADASLELTFNVSNPNPVALSVAQVDYALFVEGHPVASGKPARGLALRAQGNTPLVFPADVRFSDLAPVVETFLTKDVARYRAEGHLGVQTPLGVLKLPIAYEGTFEVPKLPQVQLEAPRITQLSLAGATLELPLVVTQKSSYPLPVSDIGGQLSIAGAEVGRISTGDLGQLAPNTPREVKIPLQIQFLGAAAGVAHALQKGEAAFAFQGQVQSGGGSIPLVFKQNLKLRR